MYNPSVNIEHHIDNRREIESWYITVGKSHEKERKILLGAHATAHDFFATRPLLIIPITEPPNNGEVFRGFFVLRAQYNLPEPEDITHFLVNSTFMERCLPINPDSKHLMNDIEDLFDDNFHTYLSLMEEKLGLICIGILGNNPVHHTRGC